LHLRPPHRLLLLMTSHGLHSPLLALPALFSPSWTQIYSGDTVTVRCEIQGGEGAQWTYEWRQGHHKNLFPTVTLQPSWTQIYSGETVTVRCETQGAEGAQWTYEWSPAKLNTPPTSNEYRISSATQSDSGGYSCRGTRDYLLTEWSDTITLTVSSKPKAELRADRTAVPVGGSVTLTCSVNPSSSYGWKYYWYRDGKSYQPVTNGQISVSEGGLYSCRGGRGEPVYYTEDSQPVWIDTTGAFKLELPTKHYI
uniref:Ig-like domain-containing protein n=1 Tax=Maylandia zebra TaxID=106582 RepID=A0A3P9D3N2_9CICH